MFFNLGAWVSKPSFVLHALGVEIYDGFDQTFVIQSLLMSLHACLTCKAPNTIIAEFANTVDPDETAHNEPSRLNLQCLLSSL